MDFSSINAVRAYEAAREAAQAASLAVKPAARTDELGEGPSFAEALAEAARSTVDNVARGERTALEAVKGRADAHSVVEALATAELALETAVTVRDKVVEAYREILRMPV